MNEYRKAKLAGLSIKKIALIFQLFLPFTTSSFARGILNDRMIVEINDKSYTQRQLEMFFTVRQSLQQQQQKEANDGVVSKDNWDEALKFFVEEMLLAQEADRVGGGVTGKDQFDKLKKRALERLIVAPKLAQRLDLTTQNLDSILLTIVKVETLRNFKKQTYAVRGADDLSSAPARNQQKTSWIDEVYARSLIRFYQGAHIYRPLTRAGA